MRQSPGEFSSQTSNRPVQLPHTEREVSVWRFDTEMIVVIHETICMTDPIVSLVGMGEDGEEGLAVAILSKDGLLFVSPRSHLVHGSGVFNAQGAGYREKISGKKRKSNSKDLIQRCYDV